MVDGVARNDIEELEEFDLEEEGQIIEKQRQYSNQVEDIEDFEDIEDLTMENEDMDNVELIDDMLNNDFADEH